MLTGADKEPVHCPICKAAVVTEAQTFPFCSPRCRTIDLGNWLDEKYAIEAPAPASDDRN